MNRPAVSVIVPTYRAGRYLIELCKSLQEQTYPHFEVLVLDDGSDDHLSVDLEPYRSDVRFKFAHWDGNRGVNQATYYLLSQVCGDYWCYPGADDILLPNFIEERIRVIESGPEVAMVHGPGCQIDEEGK